MSKELKLPANESESMALFKATYGKDLTDLELALFFTHAKSVGLDPLKRQIYAVKRSGRVVHQTGIDGLRAIAARSGVHAGTDEIIHTYKDNKLVGSKCTVWKMVAGQRVAFVGTALWKEFYGPKSPQVNMPQIMLGKCAEAQALRKAFPEDIGQLYVDEEIQPLKDVSAPSDKINTIEARLANTKPEEKPEYGEEDFKKEYDELVNEPFTEE